MDDKIIRLVLLNQCPMSDETYCSFVPKSSNELGSVWFLGIETKPNNLFIIKIENRLNIMKPFKPNRLKSRRNQISLS